MTLRAALLGLGTAISLFPMTAFAQTPTAEPAKCVETAMPAAGDRVALIIANSSYDRGYSALKSPAADQAVVVDGLRRAGFATTVLCDADRASMLARLDDFAALSRQADAALVYFAGHGFEWQGHNYLVPVDAQDSLESAADLEAGFISVDRLFASVEGSRVGLVFFDACRSEVGPKIEAGGADMLGGANTIAAGAMAIGFSTAQGQPAFDAAPPTYTVSPFAESLGEHLVIPGLELAQMYRAIHRDVRRRTQIFDGGPQEPWLIDQLAEDFYFRQPLSQVDESMAAGPPLEVDIQALENGDEFAVVSRLLKERGVNDIAARARARDAMAQYLFSYMLEFGVGIKADRTTASQWLRRSADGGNAAALTALGFEMQFTSGTPEEDEAGHALLRQAMEQDFARAAYFLGEIEQAARDGDPYSAYLLADRGDTDSAFALLEGLFDADDDMAAVWLCELARAQGKTAIARRACQWAALSGFRGSQAQYGSLLAEEEDISNGNARESSAHWAALGRRTVYFELDRGSPHGLNQQFVIADLIAELRRRPHGQITLEAHTDQLFSSAYSVGLSSRMADAIRQQLSDAGIADSRIETISFGSTQPVTQGFGIQPLNRRVEIKIDWLDD